MKRDVDSFINLYFVIDYYVETRDLFYSLVANPTDVVLPEMRMKNVQNQKKQYQNNFFQKYICRKNEVN